uniref:YicC family protein n=1 Tax=mine drainage metagenome TaxID=410659 RepID=E6QIU1_9ZZZZ
MSSLFSEQSISASVDPSPRSAPVKNSAGVTDTSHDAVASMTGYARSSVFAQLPHAGQIQFTLILKSVNHRFLDLQFRLPTGQDALEMELRRELKANLRRGHIELTLMIESATQQRGIVNHDLIASYVEAFRNTAREYELGGQPDLNTILRMPGVLQSERQWSAEDSEALSRSVLQEAGKLILSLQSMRQREGSALAAILTAALDRLDAAVASVAELRPEVDARHLLRLTQKLETLPGVEGNRQRILEEVAMLVERSDVAEEIERLHTHIDHFREMLSTGGEIGKKLDFLLQEMNREANTLLSKTASVAGAGTRITELGLAMKAEIEKLREQIQNLE